MSQLLINHNECLLRLQNEGYNIEVRDGFLLVHHVPYLSKELMITSGILAMSLSTAGNTVIQPQDHTAYWCGEKPFNIDGTQVVSLINGEQHRNLGNGIVSNFFLSCQPGVRSGKYDDYYQKVTQYFHTISDPAYVCNKDAAEKCRKAIVIKNAESSLMYADTNASRVCITGLNEKLKGQKIAIIGLGGTGGYVLDLIAKVDVAEIHLYDDDIFDTHNAFRAPGAPCVTKLEERLMKVDYFKQIYSCMHKRIFEHKCRVDANNVYELDGMDFVFMCIDSVESRIYIANHLTDCNVPFVDSGLGVNISDDSLIGQIRATWAPKSENLHLRDAFGNVKEDDNVYATNIQIAELNCMAAVMMVLKWKKHFGVYQVGNYQAELNSVYAISDDKVYHNG